MQLKEFVTIRIGKNGLNENSLKEIKKNLDKKSDVKIKLLKNFTDKKEAISMIMAATEKPGLSSRAIGNTILLEFKKK